MDTAEFDKFAEEYLATHRDNVRLSGEDPEYFARYKLEELRRRFDAWGRPDPAAVLDFGTGIGASLPWLRVAFPEAQITGLDVSAKSLAVAEQRFPGVADLVRYDGGAPPFEDASFDLVFSACVFHHIDVDRHLELLESLKRLLRPGGLLVVFEHNPVNPVTRYIVATCPFDENAVLIPAPAFARRLETAGFSRVETVFTGFFPGPLKALRPLERLIGVVPLGAQYYVVGHA